MVRAAHEKPRGNRHTTRAPHTNTAQCRAHGTPRTRAHTTPNSRQTRPKAHVQHTRRTRQPGATRARIHPCAHARIVVQDILKIDDVCRPVRLRSDVYAITSTIARIRAAARRGRRRKDCPLSHFARARSGLEQSLCLSRTRDSINQANTHGSCKKSQKSQDCRCPRLTRGERRNPRRRRGVRTRRRSHRHAMRPLARRTCAPGFTAQHPRAAALVVVGTPAPASSRVLRLGVFCWAAVR